VLATNTMLQAPPSQLAFSRAVQVTAVVGALAPDGSSIPVTLSCSASGAALFVTLTTLAQGRFSENLLPILPAGSNTTVLFVPILAAGEGGLPMDAALLASSLRIDHLALYV